MERVALFAGLTPEEQTRLRELSELFVREKHLDPVAGLQLDDGMRLVLAAQACLPILHLGLDHYDNWLTLIVYPKTFITQHAEVDAAGVVHPPRARVGEAWFHGPVIVSWRDVERDLAGEWDYPMNVVIHEMCHQLDGRNGGFDGMPPLPSGMDAGRWIREFSRAFEHLRADCDQGVESWLDPYAGESPAEFFAVACEAFFVDPWDLQEGYPGVYGQLCHYFQQDPARRMEMGR